MCSQTGYAQLLSKQTAALIHMKEAIENSDDAIANTKNHIQSHKITVNLARKSRKNLISAITLRL